MDRMDAITFLNTVNESQKNNHGMGITWRQPDILDIRVPGTQLFTTTQAHNRQAILSKLLPNFEGIIGRIQDAVRLLANGRPCNMITDTNKGDAIYITVSGAGALAVAQTLDEQDVDFVNYRSVPKRQRSMER